MPSEVVLRCPVCASFLAALPADGTAIRVACHNLSIRVERTSAVKVMPTA